MVVADVETRLHKIGVKTSIILSASGQTPLLLHDLFKEIESINTFLFGVPQGSIMDDLDFERRRELRRQKREEMRLEAERWDVLAWL